MTLYRYRAAGSDGAIVRGLLAGASPEDVNLTLGDQGLLAIELSPARTHTRQKVSQVHLALMFRSISSLLKAGLPLERAVALTEPIVGPVHLRDDLSEVRRLLHEGKSFGEALGTLPRLIPPAVAGVIRAGERASRLGPAIEQVARQLEQEAETAARLRQALTYPLILLATGSTSVLLIGTVVLPRFAAILTDVGGTLPPLARILLSGGAMVARLWPVALLLVASAGSIAAVWARTPAGRLRVHEALLVLPMIGNLRHGLATARLTRALGSGLGAGLPMLRALEIAEDAAADQSIRQRLRCVQDRVARGEPLAASLLAERAVVASAGQILAVGESSGQLAQMAERAAEFAAGDAERRLALLTRLVEPAMVLFFGGLLALVAGALLQAVYSLRPGI